MATLSKPVLVCFMLLVVAAEPAHAAAPVSAKTPSVIMFAPPPSEIDQLTDRDISIQDFLAYWIDIQRRLRQELPRVTVLETDANEIVLPDTTVVRSRTLHGYGLVFSAPDRPARVIDGVVKPDDCLSAARVYFEVPESVSPSLSTVEHSALSTPSDVRTPSAPTTKGDSPSAVTVQKIRSFVGGKAKIDAVQATHSVGSMRAQTPQGPMDVEVDSLVKYPDYSRRVMKTPMGEMTIVTTPDGAFMSSPMGSQDMPGSQRAMMRSESRADIIFVLKNIDNPKYIFTIAGTERVGAVDAQILTVDADGTAVKWLVDPSSGKILRRLAQSPRGEAVTEYTDWKTFDGLTLPVAFNTTTNGQLSGSGKMTTMEINPTVDPRIFEKPAPK